LIANDLRVAVIESIQEVAPEADVASLGEDTDIREELDLDSMDVLNVMIGIHKRTGIDVPERHYARLGTLRKAVDYLSKQKP
jgi:acyl carrier protein